MARKKKTKEVEVELYDDKKHEVVYDFGEWKVPTSWDEVTLQMFSDYMTLAASKKELYDADVKAAKEAYAKTLDRKGVEKLESIDFSKAELPDENDVKYSLTDRELLSLFTGKTLEEIELLPVELYNAVMAKMAFLVTPMEEKKAKKDLYIDGIHLCVNDMEKLKVKEWEDCSTVMKNNPYDYPSLLAILCREVTGRKTDQLTGLTWLVNEDYDSEFANEKFDGRRELFSKLPVTEAMPIVNFFLLKGIESSGLLENSIQEIKVWLLDAVESLFDSIRSMGLRRVLYLRQTTNLKKLKKSIEAI